MTADPHAEARRIAEKARQWRMWATGERKEPPHNLLAFTSDVIALSAREERLQEELEEARQQIADSFREVAEARKERRALQRQIERGGRS